jgi:hypothetical protein
MRIGAGSPRNDGAYCVGGAMKLHCGHGARLFRNQTAERAAPRTNDYNIHSSFSLPVNSRKNEIADEPAKATFFGHSAAGTKIRSVQRATGQEWGHKTGQFQSTLRML